MVLKLVRCVLVNSFAHTVGCKAIKLIFIERVTGMSQRSFVEHFFARFLEHKNSLKEILRGNAWGRFPKVQYSFEIGLEVHTRVYSHEYTNDAGVLRITFHCH